LPASPCLTRLSDGEGLEGRTRLLGVAVLIEQLVAGVIAKVIRFTEAS